MLVLLEAYFTDDPLHTAVDGDDEAAHLGVVGVFHPSETDEAGDDPGEAREEHEEDDGVDEDFLVLSFHSE